MKTPAPEHRRNAARVKNESGGMKLGGNTLAVCPRGQSRYQKPRSAVAAARLGAQIVKAGRLTHGTLHQGDGVVLYRPVGTLARGLRVGHHRRCGAVRGSVFRSGIGVLNHRDKGVPVVDVNDHCLPFANLPFARG